MKNMGDELSRIMSSMPEGMTKAMGIDEQSFNSILGMYNSYYGVYIIVLLSIYTASTGATIVSKEEKNKTAEFLMTKPISRKNIFNTKLFVLFTLTFAAFFVQTLTAFVLIIIFGDHVKWSVFITMHTHGLILILFFTCVGVFSSMLVKSKWNFMGMMVGIVFGSYFLNAIAIAADSISWMAYVSPFHYLTFSVSDPHYSINIVTIGVVLSVSILLLFISYRLYDQKDIST
jgi:ABC-2 type transport system permease protein